MNLHGLASRSGVAAAPRVVGNTYRVRVTGAADSLPDLTAVPSSLQIDKRSAAPSFFSVVLPMTPGLVDSLFARPNANCVIQVAPRYAGEATGPWVELDWFHPDTVRFDEGPTRKSVTLSGYRQSTNTAPVTLAVDDRALTAYRRQSDGRYVFGWVSLNTGLNPGDRLTYLGDVYVVNYYSLAIEPAAQTFTLTAEKQA
jgi:hypothetical protein